MEYTIRDRGRELGSFTMDQIETKLDDHQIGMMAEVYDGDRWITIAELIENLEQERNQSAKRLTLQQEATAKRNEEEQQKRLLELEIQKERTRQMEVEQKRESPLLEQKSKFSETGLVHNINGAGFAGYICVALSFLLACIFWISIIYGFPLIIYSVLDWCGNRKCRVNFRWHELFFGRSQQISRYFSNIGLCNHPFVAGDSIRLFGNINSKVHLNDLATCLLTTTG